MKKIKAFVGVIGSGKDYQCKLLEQKGYKRIAFADSLRELTWRIFNWRPQNELEYDEFKKQLFCAPGYPSVSGREFLQRLGTDGRNIIGDDIWLNALKKTIDNSPEECFCISDLRFQNEFDFIKSLDNNGYSVEIIFTNYRSERYDDKNTHESEALAQTFLKLGNADLDYLYKEIKEGDIVRINNHTGLASKFIGYTSFISKINPLDDYQYEIDEWIKVKRIEFDLISKYNP